MSAAFLGRASIFLDMVLDAWIEAWHGMGVLSAGVLGLG